MILLMNPSSAMSVLIVRSVTIVAIVKSVFCAGIVSFVFSVVIAETALVVWAYITTNTVFSTNNILKVNILKNLRS